MLGKMKPDVPAHPVNIKVSETLKYGSTFGCCSLHCTPAALLTSQPLLSVHFPVESSVRNNMCCPCSTALHTETRSLVWCRLWDIIRLWAWIPLYIETGRKFYVLYYLYVVCCVFVYVLCVRVWECAPFSLFPWWAVYQYERPICKPGRESSLQANHMCNTFLIDLDFGEGLEYIDQEKPGEGTSISVAMWKMSASLHNNFPGITWQGETQHLHR